MKVNRNNKPTKGTDLRFDGEKWSKGSGIEGYWTTAAFIPPRISALRKVGKELTAGKCGSTYFTTDTQIGSPRHASPFEDFGNIATSRNLPLFRALIASTCVGFVSVLRPSGEWAKVSPKGATIVFYKEFPVTESVVIRYGVGGGGTNVCVEIAENGSKASAFYEEGEHSANSNFAEHLRSFIKWAKAGDPQGIIDWSRLESALPPIPTPEPVRIISTGEWQEVNGVLTQGISFTSSRLPRDWACHNYKSEAGDNWVVAGFGAHKHMIWLNPHESTLPGSFYSDCPHNFLAAEKVWREVFGSEPSLKPIDPDSKPVVEEAPLPEPKPLVLASWQVKGEEVGEIEYVSHRDLEAMRWSGSSFPLPDGTFLFVAPTWNYYVFHTSRQFGRLAAKSDWDYYRAAILVWACELDKEESSLPKFIH